MKKLFAILIAVTLTSCEPEYELITIDMKSVDGSWSTATYDLPKGAEPYIMPHYGGYDLRYSYKGVLGIPRAAGLKPAIIDYKVVKRWGKTLKHE